jgi:archaellum component FlaF (FlaF/FlaG flagellin family)
MVVGQETVYELIAKNHGNSNLNGLIVRLSLPNSVAIGSTVATSGATQPDREDGDNALLWEIETIPSGQSQSLKLPLKTASPEHFAMNVEWTALPQSQSLQVKVHEPKLDLALEGPAEAEYGVPLKYRLRIKNPGNAVAKMVEVRLAAESFGSNQSVVGDIAPGAERVIDVELLFEQGGVIPILASAVSSVSQVQSQSQIEVRVRQAKLVAKWEGSNSYYQGSIGDYRLILTNEGDAAINQAKCSVSLPNGADLVALPPGSVRRGSSVQWDVKKLMPGESVAVPLRFTFSQLGQVELVLQAEAKNSAAVVAKHSLTVDAVEDLKLAVIPPVAPAPIDQPVPYEIEIHNRGTKAAQNVSVLAQFSDGVEPVKVEGHSGQIVPGQVVFESIRSIGPNERITLKVFVQASSSGIHRFRAEVKGSSGEADLVQEGSTRYMASGVQPQVRR